LQHSRHHRDLHSFPTRRSSDLIFQLQQDYDADLRAITGQLDHVPLIVSQQSTFPNAPGGAPSMLAQWRMAVDHPDAILCAGPKRSEEHTSELQSRFDLVCRLLL